MQHNKAEILYASSAAAWRKWLEKNHLLKEAVWLVFHTKSSGRKSISWSDAVDVAICFGWIDSKKIKIDPETAHQFFSKRKPAGTWSKVNKEKVAKLIENGLMAPAGIACVEKAKQNGSWTLLDDVEALIISEDLQQAFSNTKGAEDYFQGLGKTIRKMMLQWIMLAKRPATRQQRIDLIATLAGQGKKLPQF